MEYTRTEIRKAINQLENLKYHSEGADDYEENKKALMIAIKILKDELQSEKEKVEIVEIKAKSEFLCKNMVGDTIPKDKCIKEAFYYACDHLKDKLINDRLIEVKYDEEGNYIKCEAKISVVKKQNLIIDRKNIVNPYF